MAIHTGLFKMHLREQCNYLFGPGYPLDQTIQFPGKAPVRLEDWYLYLLLLDEVNGPSQVWIDLMHNHGGDSRTPSAFAVWH